MSDTLCQCSCGCDRPAKTIETDGSDYVLGHSEPLCLDCHAQLYDSTNDYLVGPAVPHCCSANPSYAWTRAIARLLAAARRVDPEWFDRIPTYTNSPIWYGVPDDNDPEGPIVRDLVDAISELRAAEAQPARSSQHE